MVKNTPANAGDVGLIPESGRFPRGGSDNPLQYSSLGNPMDRGAWWAIVYEAAKELDMSLQLNNETIKTTNVECIHINKCYFFLLYFS